MIDMDAKRFLEDPDVQGESGLNTYYSRDLVLEMLDAAIDAALAAAPAQPDTHPTTGEPMGTDAQEATAWRPKAENLEREIKPLRLYENLAKEYGILVFEGLEELQRENAALRDALQGAVSMAKDAHGHWDEDRDAKVGKHLLALAGANKGYDKRADAIHAAIAAQQGEKT